MDAAATGQAMKTIRMLAAGFVAVLLLRSSALAMGPPYKTDAELTQNPIIIVATWDRAEMRPHERVRGNIGEKYEMFTELNVHRVIKGDIKPGKHTILMGWGIGWGEDGTGLATYTSTHIQGDANNVCHPNIWFLERKRSWDEADKTLYYHIPHYRAIQPPFLEEYFAALGSGAPQMAVPKLLSSDNHEVLERVLRYLCGDVLPWPHGDGFAASMYLDPPKRGNVLKGQAEAVRGLIGRDVGEVRVTAASVYAFLADKKGIGYLRSLLTDADPSVRAIAMGTLALQRDRASIDAIGAAAQGVADVWLGCKVIDALADWGDAGLVPALIPFLDIDSFGYNSGDELGIPAVKARKALHKLTGCWFPYDAEAASRVWKEAAAVADPAKRKALLARLLPDTECPVIAELVGSPWYEPAKPPDEPATQMSAAATRPCTEPTTKPKDVMATVRLTNASTWTVTICTLPSSVGQEWPSGSAWHGTHRRPSAPAKEDFVDLRPGESTDFPVMLDDSFLLAEPNDRKLALTYESNGRALGLKAWIGTVYAEFGSKWHEERKLEKVEERWPNGTLKMVGQTMNGRRDGQWEYFNEQGNRIKEDRYTGNVGSGECNPDYSSNKGAGAKKPSLGEWTPYAVVAAIFTGACLSLIVYLAVRRRRISPPLNSTLRDKTR